MAMLRQNPPTPADIVTYQYNSKLVYVKPGVDYQEALDVAQKEFPELSHISRDLIEFSVSAHMGGGKQHVRISESAWAATVARLLRGEIIQVDIRSDPTLLKDAPPIYLEVPQETDGTKRHSHSTPSSRSHSRAPSPASVQHRKSWFGRP